MLAVSIVVFREVLEAALIIGLLAAATRELPHRWHWLLAGIGAGIGGAMLVAAFAARLAAAAEGMGQELFNSAVLMSAVAMLGWHTVWMSRHGREMAADARRLGAELAAGLRQRWFLAAVVALAVLREGSELVLFISGLAASDGTTAASLALGGGVGLAAGAVVGVLLYAGLASIPLRHLFRVTNLLLVLLAAGLAAQAAAYLTQAGYLPDLRPALWDTSGVLAEHGVVGKVLHTLIGYRARPSGIEVLFYLITCGVLLTLERVARRREGSPAMPRGARVAGVLAFLAGGALLTAPAGVRAEFKVYSPYVEQGELELEVRGKFMHDDEPELDGDKELIYEIGYTPTARWHTAVLLEQEQEHEEGEDHDLNLEAFAWENILQLTEPGEYWADFGVYLEYEKSLLESGAHQLEGKLLVEKNVGRWIFTANPIFALPFGDVDDHDVSFEYAWATRYRLRPEFEPGFEAFGELGPIDDVEELSQQTHEIGPDVRGAFRLGEGKVLYNVGYLFGVTDASHDGAVKFELEYELHF